LLAFCPNDFISFDNSDKGHVIGSYLLLIYQNRDDARQFMKHLHPDLGVGKISALNSVTIKYLFIFKNVGGNKLLPFQCRIAGEILWSRLPFVCSRKP
jgi:hypothetical protein